LSKTAFTAANYDEQLDEAEEDFLQHPRAVRSQDGKLVITSLLDWYGADFADNQEEMFEYLSDFVSPDLLDVFDSNPEVVYDYNWGLNAE